MLNLRIAWRYFVGKKSVNAINIISWVSMLAITVITLSFLVLLSVFNGFEGLVKSLYASFYTDIRVGAVTGKIIHLTPQQIAAIKEVPGVSALSLIMEEKALMQNGDAQTIVYLKGVDENYANVAALPEKLIRGSFETGTEDQPGLILGSGIENALDILSDRALYPVTAYLFKPGTSINIGDPFQSFSADNMATTGTFFIQQDIDNKYAITNLHFMKRMLGMDKDEYGAVEISLSQQGSEKKVQEGLRNLLGPDYLVQTRYEQNQSLYSIMTLEKWATFGILFLMLIVASFTLVGALSMLVLEKQKDIQVLKAMGATKRFIRRIFITEGLLLAGIGAILGAGLAILLCWAQVHFKLIGIQGGSFLIDHYPVQMVPMDFVLVVITVILVAAGAAWFPAKKAAAQPILLKTQG